jgi:hypothetical protein
MQWGFLCLMKNYLLLLTIISLLQSQHLVHRHYLGH